jgi:hypothetical protein
VLDVELPVAKADRRLEDPDPELREQLSGVVDVLVAAVTPAPAGVLS